MSSSTTPRPRITTLTLRRIATGGTRTYYQYALRPPAAPGLVIAAPTNTVLVELLI